MRPEEFKIWHFHLIFGKFNAKHSYVIIDPRFTVYSSVHSTVRIRIDKVFDIKNANSRLELHRP